MIYCKYVKIAVYILRSGGVTMGKLKLGAVAALIIMLALSGCFQVRTEMRDGYYRAEAAEFDAYGWKEYVVIYVSMGKIITVDYDAFNRSGFVKSWDMDCMRVMNRTEGTYPNEFTRAYADALISNQDPWAVDAISGATRSHETFRILAEAAANSAHTGEKQTVLVDLS